MIPARLRQQVRDRVGLRCEYCLLAVDDAFLPHEPDHVIALKHGGATDEANLALACFDCNRCKGSDIASLDTETGALCALFNPRSDVWATHFATAAGAVGPRTAVARVASGSTCTCASARPSAAIRPCRTPARPTRAARRDPSRRATARARPGSRLPRLRAAALGATAA